MLVLKNETLINRNDAVIDIEDRGYQFGDGVYEVIRYYDGEWFLLDDHLERLQYSLDEAEIDYNVQEEKLKARLHDLMEQNQVQDGGVYLQVTRGFAPRNHPYPEHQQPTLIAYPLNLKRPTHDQTHGIHTITAEDFRWLRCDIKSLNLLGNVMTKQKAIDTGASEAIFYRDESHVTEGSSTNVFIVKNGELITHPADHYILNGITRRHLLYLAERLDIPYRIEVFGLDALKNADEVFVSSTSAEIKPVISVDDQIISNGEPGPITNTLLKNYFDHLSVTKLPNHI
ncbi:D-amino-acid transaminase [Alkalibacillus salilacus]|uniref:D-alanine aminotransferase n=1 Tax=Alkalibacillus salilacus TaxID=284582 RepID=A0ABT9VH74_9BACI|nr:D-amino-acid transaminase [Alkalibacillus salilacus]MDQ0160317.1 D-alanine transaminase [Alkalibacillus salilacus]